MALIAPSRRDTRQTDRRGTGFGRRAPQPAAQHASAAAADLDAPDDRNWLGLSRLATFGAVAGLIAFVGWRGAQLQDLRPRAGCLDRRPPRF